MYILGHKYIIISTLQCNIQKLNIKLIKIKSWNSYLHFMYVHNAKTCLSWLGHLQLMS
jgi:hypothetical protein